MHLSSTLASTVLLASASLVNAQSGDNMSVSAPASPTLTASGWASTGTGVPGTKVHVVQVSNANVDLTFSPADIRAAPGDMVQFQFFPRNHSVVQSTFDQPCQPINDIQKDTPGFFSGFMPVSPNATVMPTFTIAINDTKPIWFYCSQARHCQQGMVGVINPPAANTSRTLESFKALAANAPANVSPGQTGGSSNGTGGFGGSGSGSDSGSGSTGGTTISTSTTVVPDPSSTNTTSPASITGPISTGAGSALSVDRTMIFGVAATGAVALVMGLFM